VPFRDHTGAVGDDGDTGPGNVVLVQTRFDEPVDELFEIRSKLFGRWGHGDIGAAVGDSASAAAQPPAVPARN